MDTNMITTIPTLTMRHVVWQKAVRSVHEKKVMDMAKTAFYLLLTLILCLYAVDNGGTVQALMDWRGGAIPNLMMILFAAYMAPRLFAFLWVRIAEFAESMATLTDMDGTTENDDTIEGMETQAVISHLIEHATFKRDDIEEKFAVPRYQYTALVKKLKALGVLVAGENNMSVLNSEEWNRARLQKLFYGKETAAELEVPVNIVRPARVPSPSRALPQIDGFTCATLEETECATAVRV